MDEYYIPGFTNDLMNNVQGSPTAQPVQTAAYDMPTVSNFVGGIPGTMSSDFSGFLNKVLAQAEQQGLTQPASAPTGALSTAAQPAQPTASPQYKWGVLGGSADQPQYTVNFRSNKRGDMPLTVSADTPIFLYDNKTKQVIASGVGFEGADAVAEAVSRMSAQGKNNWWDIYTGPAGSTDPSQFKVAISDQKNTNFGQRFLGNIGTLLPIAVSFIPGFGQLSLAAKIGAGAAAGAGGAALKGQDILKGALLGGATSGIMNAPVLGGGKTLSGVVGGALGSVPVVGDALKEVSKIASNSPGVYDPALGGYVVSGATNATPALISGGLSSLASSQLNNALDLARKYPGTANYADRVYDKTLQDDFDATFGPTVYGKRLTDLASTATGLTGGIAGTVPGAGTYYKDENLVEVAGDKTKPPANDVTSGTTQTIVNDTLNNDLNPNDIVVTGDKGTRSFDDIVNGTTGTLTTSLFNQGPDAPPNGDKKDGDKGGPDVGDILTILGLLGGLGGGKGGTGGTGTLGDFANMRGPLNPIFSGQLPTPNMPMSTPRSMAGTDWYRYGYGPEQSFFSNVPQGAPNTSKAYTGYAEGGEVTDDDYRLAQQLIAAERSYAGEAPRGKRTPSLRAQHDYNGDLYSRYELELPIGDEGALQLNATGRGLSPEVLELAARLGGLRASHMLGGGSEYGYSAPLAGGNFDVSAYAPRGLIPSGIRASYRKQFEEGGYAVGGPGDGRDDKIPAMLSDGEYVMDAETVSMLGNGSSKAGAEALDKFRVNIRKHKGRKLSKGEFSVNAKKPEKYLKGRK